MSGPALHAVKVWETLFSIDVHWHLKMCARTKRDTLLFIVPSAKLIVPIYVDDLIWLQLTQCT